MCPTDTTGIADSFSETDQNYSTFELKKSPDFLKLQSSTGGDCFPFKDSLGVIDGYLESDQDQCVYAEEDDKMVCGYVYDTFSTTCEGRRYTIQNFAGANDAMGSNAHIVHEGACGVCSTAQDIGARMKTYGTLEAETIKCAVSYTFSKYFPALVSCFSALGFTESCSTLWAHFAATNGRKCALQCIAGKSGVTELNGPAPECAPSACLECQKDFRDDFDKLAGIEMQNAGITERIARKCSDFHRVIHDPCIGLVSGDDTDTTSTSTGSTLDSSSNEQTLNEATLPPTETTGESSARKGIIGSKIPFVTAVSLALSFVVV